MGFMRLSNGNCVMFDDVSRDTPGLTQVFIEGKRVIINNMYNIDVTVILYNSASEHAKMFKFFIQFNKEAYIFQALSQCITVRTCLGVKQIFLIYKYFQA